MPRNPLPPRPPMTPATEQLYWRVRSTIETQNLAPGDRVSTERELALRLGAGRNLLRQALAVLEQEQRVRRVIGRGGGIHVSDGKVERPLNCIVSLPTILRRQGFVASSIILNVGLTIGETDVTRALQLPQGAPVVRMRRVRLADGEPLSLETTSLPSARFPRLLTRPLEGSLYEVMNTHYGVMPVHADERVEARITSAEECEALGIVEPEVVFEIRRVAKDATGRPVEFASDLFRAGRTRIQYSGGAGTAPRVADPLRKAG